MTVPNYLEIIAQGSMAKAGLLNKDGIQAAADLATKVTESNLETVRVLFTDQHGILRGKTIVSSAFVSIFVSGISVPSTLLLKDTSHRTVFPVWSEDTVDCAKGMQGASDILLVPDPETFRVLPWSPHSAWILCDTTFKSGIPIPFDSRTVLKTALYKLEKQNRKLIVGLEVEFHIYKMTDPKLAHSGATMPAQAPATENIAHGYQLLTESRYGELESVMDELRRCCQKMSLPVRSMEVEFGPGQFEFTFDPDMPLAHADNMVMFRTMVKEVCLRQGLHATFMCRPRIENGAASGWHLHQSLVDSVTQKNLFVPESGDALSPMASQWIAGLLAHATESCLLTTPTINGYKRYQSYQLAPDRIQWGKDNRGAMIRGLMHVGDTASRIENRVAETAANPYYFFTSQILGGLSGIEQGLSAPPAVETPYSGMQQCLPGNLALAIDAFESSTLYRSQLSDDFVNYLCRIKRAEWQRYLMTVSEWEQAEYFSLF
ncbi:MAG: glutamine synthetase family protein [Granulosicoccus sp.]